MKEIKPPEPQAPATPKGFIVALDGDNYLTIAERLDAKDVVAKAEELVELNFNKPIYPGLLVKVDANS